MRGVVAGLSFVAIGLIAFKLGAVGAQDDPARPEYYSSKVLPILQSNCGSCHLGNNRRGAFNMETRAGLLKGGRDGAVIVPGDPSKSLLVKLIRHEGPANDPMPMPPKKPKISDADIAVLTAWVKAGAVMPAQ